MLSMQQCHPVRSCLAKEKNPAAQIFTLTVVTATCLFSISLCLQLQHTLIFEIHIKEMMDITYLKLKIELSSRSIKV